MNNSYRSKIKSIVAAVIALVLVIVFWTGYNGLVRKDADVDLKFSLIKSIMQLRYDALTQMIGAIQGLEDYATTVWTMITDARADYSNNKSSEDPNTINETDGALTEAIYSLLVVVEDNRPVGVTVDSAYIGYMDSVLSMEYQLDVARQNYNSSVTSFNVSIRLFPNVLYASLFGFNTPKSLWEIPEHADEIPSFGD